MEKTFGVVFKKYTNLEFFSSLANSLPIIDDLCAEIYSDKEFVKLAIAGRHKHINVNYIKHNLYQQSNIYNRPEHNRVQHTGAHFSFLNRMWPSENTNKGQKIFKISTC